MFDFIRVTKGKREIDGKTFCKAAQDRYTRIIGEAPAWAVANKQQDEENIDEDSITVRNHINIIKWNSVYNFQLALKL